jgi:hypothetical protein
MDKATQQAVRDRAGRRCEYCYFQESLAELPFHFDHVIAQQHGGATTLDNLALARYVKWVHQVHNRRRISSAMQKWLGRHLQMSIPEVRRPS